ELIARAAADYARAAEVGRSDELTYLGDCARWLALLRLEHERGGPVEQHGPDMIAACDRALAVDRDSARPHVLKAAAYRLHASALARRGIDPLPIFALAIEMGGEAVRRAPGSHAAHASLGAAWLARAERWERRHGIDPRPSLTRAIESHERGI